MLLLCDFTPTVGWRVREKVSWGSANSIRVVTDVHAKKYLVIPVKETRLSNTKRGQFCNPKTIVLEYVRNEKVVPRTLSVDAVARGSVAVSHSGPVCTPLLYNRTVFPFLPFPTSPSREELCF